MRVDRLYLLLIEIPVVLFLLFDSPMVNGLAVADPATGRERGCYTMLEGLLRAKHEGQFRGIELIAGLALVPVTLLFSLLKRRRR